jgi:hypothetical protein
MKRRALLGALAGASLLARAGQAGDVASFLAALSRARDKIKTLAGPFTQERTIGLLSSKVTSTGRMTLVRPRRLRWELFPPDAAVYWVGPSGIAFRTGQGGGKLGPQAGGPFAGVLDDLLILLGGDLSELPARYRLDLLVRDGKTTLQAVPRAPELLKLVRRLELTPTDDLGAPQQVVLEEGEHDQSVIRFGALERNGPVDPKMMDPP